MGTGGSRVLIVGCGSVGTECAKRFKSFRCRITGVDRTAGEITGVESSLGEDGNRAGIRARNYDKNSDRNCDGNSDKTYGQYCERIYDQIRLPEALDEELPAADIVILSLPHGRDQGMIDGKRLSMIKGILVNISRGALVPAGAKMGGYCRAGCL